MQQRVRLPLIGLICFLGLLLGVTKTASCSSAPSQNWSNWVYIPDNQDNGIDFAMRKGANNFVERGMVFLRFRNRYRIKVYVSVKFDVVNLDTNERKTQSQSLFLDPGEVNEDPGMWFAVPGSTADANDWAKLRMTIQGMQFKQLKMEASDGTMREVYPRNELAEYERKKRNR